ncbi:MAG: hypothetical protein WBW33_37655 [Bryobacteraceae bacterium]
MLGQIISQYRIIEKLGEGGMGVVYRAEDFKLSREVALKFLPEDMTHDRNVLERFERRSLTWTCGARCESDSNTDLSMSAGVHTLKDEKGRGIFIRTAPLLSSSGTPRPDVILTSKVSKRRRSASSPCAL